MHRIEFDHFARADEQNALLGDAGENTFGEFDRSGGHGHQIRPDLGLRAHVLGHRKSALEQLVQHETQSTGLLCLAHGLFHLSQYLRFAQHHGIQPAGHAESVFYRLFLRQTINVGFDIGCRQVMIGSQPVHCIAGGIGAAIYLGTVAGRKNGRFFGRTVAYQVAQRGIQRIHIERDLLAHGKRRGLMVDSKGE